MMVGAWAGLAAVDEHTTICPFSAWPPWGDVQVIFSDDGLASFHQQLEVLT